MELNNAQKCPQCFILLNMHEVKYWFNLPRKIYDSLIEKYEHRL